MFIFGLSVSLIGMGTVLFALVLLMAVIKAIGIFTAFAEKITVIEGKGGVEGPSVHVMTPPVQAENDREIAVVIAAALAAFLRKS